MKFFLPLFILTIGYHLGAARSIENPAETLEEVKSLRRRSVGQNSHRLDNPDERGNEFEGDIQIPPHIASSGLSSETSRWPGGKLFYEIDSSFDGNDRRRIISAMEEIRRKTCIEFQERGNSDYDFVFIRKGVAGTGCFANLGRIGGRQLVNLQHPGCMGHGTIVHEFVHALGFHHEQTRPDRDDYVTVIEENIKPNTLNNFKKYKTDEVLLFNLPYDFSSIMHYSGYAFSKNVTQQSIVPKNPEVRIGQRNGLSLGDVKKLQLMYGLTDCANGIRGSLKKGQWKADMFEHKNHGGQSLRISGGPGDCVNVYYEQNCRDKKCTHFNDVTSSINTHNTCVKLYDDKDCQGKSEILKPGTHCHFNFQDCNFNDKVSSVGSC